MNFLFAYYKEEFDDTHEISRSSETTQNEISASSEIKLERVRRMAAKIKELEDQQKHLEARLTQEKQQMAATLGESPSSPGTSLEPEKYEEEKILVQTSDSEKHQRKLELRLVHEIEEIKATTKRMEQHQNFIDARLLQIEQVTKEMKKNYNRKIHLQMIDQLQWSELEPQLEAAWTSTPRRLTDQLNFRHFPKELTQQEKQIIYDLTISNIYQALEKVDSVQNESDLKKYFAKVAGFICDSFNKVMCANQKVPRIVYLSGNQIPDDTNDGTQTTLYPCGMFRLEDGSLDNHPSYERSVGSLLMVELKMDLKLSNRKRPWNFETSTILESSQGRDAILQSLRTAAFLYQSSSRTDGFVSSVFTDLKHAHFFQTENSFFFFGSRLPWKKLRGSLSFPQPMVEKIPNQSSTGTVARDVSDAPNLSQQVASENANTTDPSPHRNYPAIETIVKLLLCSAWSIQLRTQSNVNDVTLKDFEQIVASTLEEKCVGTLELAERDIVELIAAYSPKKLIARGMTRLTKLELISKLSSDDERFGMVASSGGVKQCLVLEKIDTFCSKYGHLQNELKILSQLQHLQGVPQLIHKGVIINYNNDNWAAMLTGPFGISFDRLPHSFFSNASLTISLWNKMRQIMVNVHDSGVVHGDIIPSKMMLSSDGPYLINFGGSVPNPILKEGYHDAWICSEPWSSPGILLGDNPSILSDHISLFFSFLDLASGGKLLNLGGMLPIEITYHVFSKLPESFHDWARYLLVVFGLYQEKPVVPSTSLTSRIKSHLFDPDELGSDKKEHIN